MGAKFLNFIKSPPLWFVVLVCIITLIAISATVAILVLGLSVYSLSAVVYFIAALLSGYSIYCLIVSTAQFRRSLAERLKRGRAGRFFSDYGVRTSVFAALSFLINAAYVAVNSVTAAYYLSIWYACMAAYYFSLMLVRGGVLYFDRRAIKKFADNENAQQILKTKIYLGCGIALLVLEFALAAAVVQMVTDDSHVRTGIVVAIATAAYTFYKFILAVVNIVRAKRFRDPAVQCLRNINLVDALVSMLALEITLVSSVGTSSQMLAMNAVMGAAVCLVTIVTGIVMIVQAAGKLRGIKHGRQRI